MLEGTFQGFVALIRKGENVDGKELVDVYTDILNSYMSQFRFNNYKSIKMDYHGIHISAILMSHSNIDQMVENEIRTTIYNHILNIDIDNLECHIHHSIEIGHVELIREQELCLT